MSVRQYTTRRTAIIKALVEKLKEINGTGNFLSDLGQNVHPRLLFWDEINEFPVIHINAGSERRVYQGGGYKERYVMLTIRCYVHDEDAVLALEKLLEDVETVIESNSRLAYQDSQGVTQTTHQSTVLSIDTDEGVLSPLGIGEMLIEVQY